MSRGSDDEWTIDEDSELEFLGFIFERIAEGTPQDADRFIWHYVFDNDIDSSSERVMEFSSEVMELLTSIRDEFKKGPDTLLDELEEPAPSIAFELGDWKVRYVLNKFFLRDPSRELPTRLQGKDWRKAIYAIREILTETQKVLEGGLKEIIADMQA
jgi:hypothetical protein